MLLTTLVVMTCLPFVEGSIVDDTCTSPSSSSKIPDHSNEISEEDPQYLIIGAGGSGIQMALYLQKFGHTYTVLERNDVAGSFWLRYPRFRELISINKWTRREDHRLRFDMHSFLEAPITMMDVTEAYFPSGDEWQEYMAAVVQMADLNVEYNADVREIVSDEDTGRPCVIMSKDGTKRCAQRRVFVGTGLEEKQQPLLEAMGAIYYSQVTKSDARRKRVCIFGNGNAGFETAQNTFDVADKVTVYGKRAHRTAAVTKYTGDFRVKVRLKIHLIKYFHCVNLYTPFPLTPLLFFTSSLLVPTSPREFPL